MKCTRMKRKSVMKRKHRLRAGCAYAFSVFPPKGHKFFTQRQAQDVAVGKEAVVQDDVIDLYFTHMGDAKQEVAYLKRKGFKITKIGIDIPY